MTHQASNQPTHWNHSRETRSCRRSGLPVQNKAALPLCGRLRPKLASMTLRGKPKPTQSSIPARPRLTSHISCTVEQAEGADCGVSSLPYPTVRAGPRSDAQGFQPSRCFRSGPRGLQRRFCSRRTSLTRARFLVPGADTSHAGVESEHYSSASHLRSAPLRSPLISSSQSPTGCCSDSTRVCLIAPS